MTLKEAVAIASSHTEARMTLSINGEEGRFAGYIDMVVHSPGDGGFFANKAGADDPGFLVQWETVGNWSISLLAIGTK